MKILLLFVLIPLLSLGNARDIDKVRTLYQKAAAHEDACQELIEFLTSHSDSKPLLLAYKASATMMMAKHSYNPFSKLDYFNEGKELLEKAIMQNPENLEAKVLRFLAQSKTPFFLGYNEHLEEDRKKILEELPKLDDVVLKKYLIALLDHSNSLNNQDINQLKNT